MLGKTMNAPVRIITALGVVVATASLAAAQTADEIVEKHLAATGGRAALGKLVSRVLSGTITVTTPVGEFSGPVEVINQAPNKSRTLIKLDLGAAGAQMTVDQRFDGTNGYVLDSLQGNRDITGDQLEAMRNAIFPTPFLNYKAAGMTVTLEGKEKIDAGEAYVLVLTPKTGPPMRTFIDAQSFLQVRQVVKANVPPVGETEQTVEYLDQRDVDGVKLAFQLKISSTLQTFTLTIVKVEHNAAVDQTLFVKPAN
jgi:hypothetical protein